MFRTAIGVENVVRQNGAVPATIGIIKGKIHIGMFSENIEVLARKSKTVGEVLKVSRRDLPYVMSQKLSGGTTVSATSLLSYKAGIQIFATGGIGGVHYGAEQTLDISADLTELSRTPITVVSAGVKSILDIEKTLEVLETNGVTVAVLSSVQGNDVEFPAFFTAKSSHKAPMVVKNVSEAAAMVHYHDQLKLENGILIAVPIPEKEEANCDTINSAIQDALKQAKQQNIKGKSVTPYILQKVNEVSGGESLKANIALVRNNAKIAAEIACELNKLFFLEEENIDADTSKNDSVFSHFHILKTPEKVEQTNAKTAADANSSFKPVVIGGSIVDSILTAETSDIKINGSTYKGSSNVVLGGVGQNLATCLSKLDLDPLFISAVANDTNGKLVQDQHRNLSVNGFRTMPGVATSSSFVILDKNGK